MSEPSRRARAAASSGLLALCMTFSGLAQANGATCRLHRLDGLYVFSASGFTMPAGVALPKAIVELIRFNGDGTLSVPGATVSINGAVTQVGPGGSGSYSLGEDCRGTVAFNSGPTFSMYASPKGDELWMIQTNPNNVFEGKVTRVSH